MADAQAVFGGGGNSFRLLRTLTTLGVLEPLRQAAQAGVPYLAASAGGNLAGPAIRTTNDMPIVEPGSLAALGLIPFQLNPHYLDPDPRSPHRGETRPARIEEFLAENDVPVLGLREGAWLQVSGTRAHLSGRNTGRLFRRPTGPSTSRPARTCPTCSTPAPASTSAPRLRQGAGAALAAAAALPGRAGPRPCLESGCRVGHDMVTWCVGAGKAVRSSVDESTTKKTITPETSCLPYRSVAART